MYIRICITDNRMKIKDKVFQVCTKVTILFYLLNAKYEVDVILRTHYFRRFYDLSVFIEQRFELIYKIIFIRSS